MKETHGIIVIDKNLKILCVHPTGANMLTWSIPKGGADEGETSLEACKRELFEETNFILDNYVNHIIYYEKIGKFKYKARKTLVAHIAYIDLPLSDMELTLKCNSKIDGSDKLECDIVSWLTIDSAMSSLHYTQIEAFNEIHKKILKKNLKSFDI